MTQGDCTSNCQGHRIPCRTRCSRTLPEPTSTNRLSVGGSYPGLIEVIYAIEQQDWPAHTRMLPYRWRSRLPILVYAVPEPRYAWLFSPLELGLLRAVAGDSQLRRIGVLYRSVAARKDAGLAEARSVDPAAVPQAMSPRTVSQIVALPQGLWNCRSVASLEAADQERDGGLHPRRHNLWWSQSLTKEWT